MSGDFILGVFSGIALCLYPFVSVALRDWWDERQHRDSPPVVFTRHEWYEMRPDEASPTKPERLH